MRIRKPDGQVEHATGQTFVDGVTCVAAESVPDGYPIAGQDNIIRWLTGRDPGVQIGHVTVGLRRLDTREQNLYEWTDHDQWSCSANPSAADPDIVLSVRGQPQEQPVAGGAQQDHPPRRQAACRP